MRIISWNINWQNKKMKYKEPSKIREQRIVDNLKKSKVATSILDNENPDVLALYEAGEKYAKDTDGYDRFFLNRSYKGFNNGILVYVKKSLNPRINVTLQNELMNQGIECFYPITVTYNARPINLLLVWTTIKNGENGRKNPYGKWRFTELLNVKQASNFINGNLNDVIVIGDFNVRLENKEQWTYLTRLLRSRVNLTPIISNEKTFGTNTNDHCFISPNLKVKTKLNIGKDRLYGVISDHKYLELITK